MGLLGASDAAAKRWSFAAFSAWVTREVAGSVEATRRQRYAMASWITSAAFVYYAITNSYFGLTQLGVFHGIIALSLASGHLVFHKRSVVVGSHVYLLFMLANFLITPYFEGGMRSTSFWFLPALPMVAFYILKGWAPYFYAASAVFAIAVNISYSTIDDQMPAVVDTPWQWFMVRMMCLFCYTTFGVVASATASRRLGQIEERNEEHQRAIEQADSARKAHSQFLSTMSHEIRTPMNGILGMTQFLKLDQVDDTIEQSVQSMHSSAERLLRILTQILDLSRLEAENIASARSLSKVGALLESVVNKAKSIVARQEATTTGAASELEVLTNADRLLHILHALTHNAMRQEASSPVEVGYEESNGLNQGRFFVRDHGPGVEPKVRDELRLHLAAIQAKQNFTPHGIGLSLTFAIQVAQSIDARISFETSSGVGTTFWVELPARQSEEEETPAPEAAPASAYRVAREEIRQQRLESFLRISWVGLGYYLFHALANQFFLASIINSVTVIIALAATLANRWKPRSSLGSWLFLIALHVVLGVSSLADGQFRSESLWLLPIVPMLASFLLGIEAALICLCSSFLMIVAVTAGSYWIELPQEYSERVIDYAIFRYLDLIAYVAVGFSANRVSHRQMSRLKATEKVLKQAKELAQSAQQEKSRFLERMSHVIRTPMNGLLLSAEYLLTQKLPPAQQDSVETIHRCGRHIVSLLNDVLDLESGSSASSAPAQIPFDLVQLLEDVAKLFVKKAEQAQIGIVVETKSESLHCIGDPTRTLQIVSNLVGNAIKFSDGGTVTIRLQKLENPSRGANFRKLRVQVQDQGIGITESQLPRVFQEFVQIDAEENHNRRGGSGLGLSISKRLAQSMGGDLSVTSQYGEGSVFSLDLELQKGKAPQKSEPTSSEEQVKTSEQLDVKVLIVDDNAVNRRVAQMQLKRLGCRFETANDGVQAVELAQQHRFDVILMDLRMPNMNGLEATSAIRTNAGPSQHSYIVALTADNYAEQKQQCREVGMDEHLSKPYTASQLEDLLHKAVVRAKSAAA